MEDIKAKNSKILYSDFRKQIIEDYKFAVYSRNISVTCKKDILKGMFIDRFVEFFADNVPARHFNGTEDSHN